MTAVKSTVSEELLEEEYARCCAFRHQAAQSGDEDFSIL
jgi:hypothetical protein